MVPVFVVSAVVAHHQCKLLTSDAFAYLPKPFGPKFKRVPLYKAVELSLIEVPLFLNTFLEACRRKLRYLLKPCFDLGLPLMIEVLASKVEGHRLVRCLPNIRNLVVKNDLPEKEAKQRFSKAIFTVHAFKAKVQGEVAECEVFHIKVLILELITIHGPGRHSLVFVLHDRVNFLAKQEPLRI